MRTALSLAFSLALSTVVFAQSGVFDLADAVGQGNGTLPGIGTAYKYAINRQGVFLPDPANPLVDSTFVPLEISTSEGTMLTIGQ